jgi:malate dehydrogenase (oxaloacetate-decarboxylating)(NADP+)
MLARSLIGTARMSTSSIEKLKAQALEYHRQGSPGKIKVTPTKPLTTQQDLALAYSPGVAFACEAIVADANEASTVTARGNLVAVITNGTAVLGLGAIGPLAAKPVMEGKGVLFQKFAGIDVFDIEIAENDPDKLVEIIASLEPTFGGINLEDIKAPECFYIESKLRERMQIPVFHDDQHGTAIIVAAGMKNALELVGKDIANVRFAVSGAGAAGIACLDMLVQIGARLENIFVSDRIGVVYRGRSAEMDANKLRYARDTTARNLADICVGADVFLGLSAAGVLKPEMVASMAAKPIIFALANPTPEIMPDEARKVRPDCIIATGRSDYPNQVNNALCFPYIFRGALDVGATRITEAMKVACVHTIAKLAHESVSDVAAKAYGNAAPSFGPEYLIPPPFDPRLLTRLAPAVAEAAMASGVATRPITDMKAYVEKLNQFVFRTGLMMKPVFDRARANPKRVVFAEGEEDIVLRAAQSLVEEGLARPILIGRPNIIASRLQRAGLWIKPGEHVEITNIDSDPRFDDYAEHFHSKMKRKGMTMANSKAVIRSRSTAIAAVMVDRGEADALICGVIGRYASKLKYVRDIIGLESGASDFAALSAIACDKGVYFFTDTYVETDPTAEHIAHATVMAAKRLKVFGIRPKVALLSHSNFGTHDNPSARKMRETLALLHAQMPDLEVDGEMHGDAALNEALRNRLVPDSKLKGAANLFVFPNIDAANITFNMVRVLTDGVALGPILMGTAKPAYVLTPSATVRRVVNMAAIAVVEAQVRASGGVLSD